MNHRCQISIKRSLLATAISLLVSPLLIYGWSHLIRPTRTFQERQLFQGISYKRHVYSKPRPLMVHIVTIDLTAPGIEVLVTPQQLNHGQNQIPARTASKFLTQFKLQLAINANFFYPFHEHTPWDYYPHSGDKVNTVGTAVSNGNTYSLHAPEWPVLCISTAKLVQIQSKPCSQGTAQAVAGNVILVAGGKSVPLRKDATDNDGLYPRTTVAIDRQGKKLWLVVVDGRQPFYSEGVTLSELTQMLLALGVDRALNLDGGGSTTLVVAGASGASLLNSPIHTRIPMRQRPVANHLGFSAWPLDE